MYSLAHPLQSVLKSRHLGPGSPFSPTRHSDPRQVTLPLSPLCWSSGHADFQYHVYLHGAAIVSILSTCQAQWLT